MSEQTALLFASLSHKWTPLWFGLVVVFSVVTFYSGKVLARSRKHALGRSLQALKVMRTISVSLLTASTSALVLAFLHLGCSALVSNQTRCLRNEKELGMAFLIYAQDYDERFPPAFGWAHRIAPAVRSKAAPVDPASLDAFHCPAAESPGSYGMNSALGGESLSTIPEPASTVLVFEADAQTHSFAGGTQAVAGLRHQAAPNFGVADGHAKRVRTSFQSELSWSLSKEGRSK